MKLKSRCTLASSLPRRQEQTEQLCSTVHFCRPSPPLQQTYEEVQLPLLLASRIPFFLQRDGTMPTINVPALLQLRCTRNTRRLRLR